VVFALNVHEFGTKFRNAIADAAAVELKRRFSGTAASNATASTAVAASACFAQSGRKVGEPSDFDLDTGFAGAGVTAKDLDNHTRAVEDLDARGLLKVREL
jgi:hypothetical protein